jgi:predicted kinase
MEDELSQGPVVLLMAGLPGSGKSTLAKAAGRGLGWPVLDKDTVKSTLLELGAGEDLAARASYVLLEELARDLVVEQGLSVILDTPSSYEEVIEAAQRIAADAGGTLRVVLCEAPRETRAKRLATRKRRASHVMEIDEDAEALIQRRFERLPQDAVRLWTEGPPNGMVEQIVALMRHTEDAGFQPGGRNAE